MILKKSCFYAGTTKAVECKGGVRVEVSGSDHMGFSYNMWVTGRQPIICSAKHIRGTTVSPDQYLQEQIR